jgi:hypothetical protein
VSPGLTIITEWHQKPRFSESAEPPGGEQDCDLAPPPQPPDGKRIPVEWQGPPTREQVSIYGGVAIKT